jgi:proline iminopeptidase
MSLHGGPGSGCKDKHKLTFDPHTQRVIFFDQRGSGQSQPTGSLQHNTIQDLIDDITKVADRLKIGQFWLHGNSWGSTLALVYALANPHRVAGMTIGGVFTGSKSEIDWIDKGQFQTVFPDVWEAYLERTPSEHHQNPSAYHFDKVLNGTAKQQKLSGYAYDMLESGVVNLDDRPQPTDFDDYDPSSIRIEMYYLANGCFMEEGYILKNAHKLTMPVFIVQGRYDMVCPPITAYRLHKAIANSQLFWAQSGHALGHEAHNLFRSILAQNLN